MPRRAPLVLLHRLLTLSVTCAPTLAFAQGAPPSAPDVIPSAPATAAPVPTTPAPSTSGPSSPPPAPAAPAPWSVSQAVAEAERLFVQGRVFMTRNDFAAACGRFEESLKLDPAAEGTLLNLGLCNMGLRKYASAVAHFRTVIDKPTAAPERKEVARKHLADIEPKVGSIKVVVPAAAKHPDLIVMLDGRELPAEKWDVDFPADGGEHVLEATQVGHKDFRVAFTLEYERGRGLVTLTPLEKAQDTRNLGFVVGGAGLAFFAVGAGLGISVAAQCGGFLRDTCEALDELPPQQRDSKKSSLDTQAWISNIGLGLGVAGLAVGTVLVLTSHTQKRAAPRIGFVPTVTPGGGGGVIGGAF